MYTDFAQSRASTVTSLAHRARAVAVDVALEVASSVALGLPATTVTLAPTLGKTNCKANAAEQDLTQLQRARQAGCPWLGCRDRRG